MIDFNNIGIKGFDYFPPEVIKEQVKGTELESTYQEHIATLHTTSLWDISKIESGMIVQDKYSCEVGVVTTYHETPNGILNGGVEVVFDDNHTQIYYPNQLKLIKNPN